MHNMEVYQILHLHNCSRVRALGLRGDIWVDWLWLAGLRGVSIVSGRVGVRGAGWVAGGVFRQATVTGRVWGFYGWSVEFGRLFAGCLLWGAI